MYSLVLLLAATTSMESTSCHRFRSRGCCPPPCCATPCCGTAEQAPATSTPPAKTMPAVSKLSKAEEKQLAELMGLLKKGGKLTAAELKQYDDWFRGITPAERSKEYKEMTAPAPMGPAPLSKAEEKMLKELLTVFGTKDKDGNVKFDAKALKQYEQWYREQTPAERLKEYKTEIKAAPTTPKVDDKGKGKSAQIEAPARILVNLPADAVLTIDGNATRSTSASRSFQSPTLPASGLFFYELQATVERDGMQIQVSQLVRVRAGQTTEVNIDIPVAHVLFVQR